jgi:hypothetical protein
MGGGGACDSRRRVAARPGRFGAAIVAALTAAASIARGETSIPVGTDPGSNISIKISSPATSVPRFGFLPVRVTIENLTARDGVWELRFTAGSPMTFPGMVASRFTVAVPSPQTREVWLFVPLAEPGLSSSGIPSATASAGGTAPVAARTMTTPPTIAGVYPTSPPGVRPPRIRSVRSTTSSSTVSTTFTIEQTGPAAALPPLPAGALPPGSTSSVSSPNSAGEVTRTTIVQVVATSPTVAGVPGSRAPGSTPQSAVLTAARAKLVAANLSPPGVNSRSSGQSGPPNAAGMADFTVTIVQTGPDLLLKLPDVKTLPPGFTSVTVNPTGTPGEVTREFTYVETVAVSTPRPPAGTAAPVATAPLGEKEARALLAPTGLLNSLPTVRTSVDTRSWPGSMVSGGTLMIIPIIIFDQTGPASDLRMPSAGTLPDNVRVTLHETPVAGTVKRVITVVDATQLANLRASVAATLTTTASVSDRSNLARIELMRLGYMRSQTGVQPGTQYRYTGGRSGPGGPDIIIATEGGPANLLPPVPPGTLPPGITSNITPGVLPGEVSRNFVVDINTLVRSTTVTTGLAAARTARAGVAPRPTGAPLSPTPVMIEIDGPGLSNPARVSFPATTASPFPPMAVALSLEAPLRSKLVSAAVRTPPNLAAVEPTVLPADWRVWSSFNCVLLKAEDFAALDAGRRAALRGWVALGGVLVLSPASAGTTGERIVENYGAGRIETLAMPLADLPAPSVLDAIPLTSLSPGMPDRDSLVFVPRTPMADLMTYETANVLWLCFFLVAFAALVGPVNLFVFAPAPKRHRLFVTTPLLSVAGAAAVAAAIFLQDGLGGKGHRRALVVLAADDNQAAVFQEQAAHTGFLLGRQFALDDAVALAAMPDEQQRFMPILSAMRLERENRVARGDWFRNRSHQAHLLRALVPTRARVELVGTAPDGAPIVESTLTTELRYFRLRDDKGDMWIADSVGTGRRVTLRADSRSDSRATAAPPIEDGTIHLAAILEGLTPQAAWQWTARGGPTELAPIATLRGVRWKDDDIDYAGTVVTAGKMPVAVTTPVEKASP